MQLQQQLTEQTIAIADLLLRKHQHFSSILPGKPQKFQYYKLFLLNVMCQVQIQVEDCYSPGYTCLFRLSTLPLIMQEFVEKQITVGPIDIAGMATK